MRLVKVHMDPKSTKIHSCNTQNTNILKAIPFGYVLMGLHSPIFPSLSFLPVVFRLDTKKSHVNFNPGRLHLFLFWKQVSLNTFPTPKWNMFMRKAKIRRVCWEKWCWHDCTFRKWDWGNISIVSFCTTINMMLRNKRSLTVRPTETNFRIQFYFPELCYNSETTKMEKINEDHKATLFNRHVLYVIKHTKIHIYHSWNHLHNTCYYASAKMMETSQRLA